MWCPDHRHQGPGLDADGGLVDDFRISFRDRIVVLRNAPSPAATSALAIAEHVVATIDAAAVEL